ncbi:DUF448 domain-containing protein [Deinococcus irradiatisoli]|uniref:DUF448 domain-containing protein n=1 Tax=Deinococcus irradiatisoli TaxID=2202254 RepID=A0A2Z3JI41_9DEIO|nr:DUF448 domain-containing protein [Deinococcus irradiatisoli]
MPARPAQRHVPERSCAACRRKRPQGELVRLTRTPAGWVLAGTGKGQGGRGSYVCGDTPSCWSEKKLRRAFGAQAGTLSTQLQEHHELNTPPRSSAASTS